MELVRGAFEELDLAARMGELAAEAPLVLRVVDAGDDLLVVLAAVLARLEDAHLVGADVEDAAEALAHAHRPREGHGRDPEDALDLVQELQRLLASRSSLLMKVMMGVLRARHTFEEADRLRFDAVDRVDHHQRRVDGGQHAIGVFRRSPGGPACRGG